MKYQVWVIARDPKNLQPIAEVLVFEHDERMVAEAYNENYSRSVCGDNPRFLFGVVVLGQNPLYTTETRIPGWGTPAAQYKPGDPDRMGQAVIVGGGCGTLRSTFTYNFPNTAGGCGGGAGGGGYRTCPVSPSGEHGATADDGRCVHCHMQT